MVIVPHDPNSSTEAAEPLPETTPLQNRPNPAYRLRNLIDMRKTHRAEAHNTLDGGTQWNFSNHECHE